MIAAKILIPIAITFTALSLACAIWFARSRPPRPTDGFGLPYTH